VEQDLRAAIAQNQAALRDMWPALADWEALADEQRAQLHGRVNDAVRAIFAARESLRRLPATTACICPSCRRVVLPSTWDGRQFECCGRLWGPRPEHSALPAGFWDTARPGDSFQGALAAMWAEDT
jgi:hypothetical protein